MQQAYRLHLIQGIVRSVVVTHSIEQVLVSLSLEMTMIWGPAYPFPKWLLNKTTPGGRFDC
jgi:hypothetical protein